MSQRANHIIQAWLESPSQGVLELARDWKARHDPPAKFSGGLQLKRLERVPDHTYGSESGYFVTKTDRIFFFVPREVHPRPSALQAPIYLAGDFNGWSEAIGDEQWELRDASLDGEPVYLWEGEAKRFYATPGMRFKFVTQDGHWIGVPREAPNAVDDGEGNFNRVIDPDRTGRHLFEFELKTPIDLAQPWRVHWATRDGDQSVPLRPGDYFHQLATDLPLGARIEGGTTVFRLFAPRARKVRLVLTDLEGEERTIAMEPRSADCPGDAAVWEHEEIADCDGWSYSYRLEGPVDEFGMFDPQQAVLDPYAQAALSREGPGIVVGPQPKASDGFKTPAWQDLVICEAHVRDLAALAKTDANDEERLGFRGLQRWVESPGFYLEQLGVNCVELQPVQEFDNETVDEYHWGYMTNNYFAPESTYALDPSKASGIGELQDLVTAFHRRGIAVVLDVVYNHVGVPGHLMFIDKLYYFTTTQAGDLMNWSGCGNDLRADASMAKRLIIDSCRHLIETFGIDGFRFDLAELLGADVLCDIEVALKETKPDVILIAEPWSFRGHIADQLADTGWASWNDGYRRFLKDFVQAKGSREQFAYYLKGAPWHFAHWPAQSVNYVESHDDRTWIDEITENEDGSGHLPTANDRRRTHLMAAVLFSSIGIPMVSAGQDFLRSKHGVNNTYQRGDLNALDYRRMERFPGTHAYFSDWIAFRRSARGELMRHYSRASEGFFAFWYAEDSLAAAVLYNADLSQGDSQLLLAVNPTLHDVEIAVGEEVVDGKWVKIADHERFISPNHPAPPVEMTENLWLPALGCGLWCRPD
ncbi:alpha-amylase family glycosyl hydrolase [Opitutaceae bacterium]|nr:alpha-amylase family glycosyl hydrolase [Opitutaceae bacterium]